MKTQLFTVKLPLLLFHHTESLPDVKVLAETKFLFRGDKSALIYTWGGYGLRLHVPAGSSASFTARVIHSENLELPEGTESVSPMFWVSSEGEVTGPVGVEIEHWAEITDEEGYSHLGFMGYKLEKQAPFELKEYRGQFSSSLNFGRIDVDFSEWWFTIKRTLRRNAPMFQAKLYYRIMQPSEGEREAHIVIAPDSSISKVS